jgi:hypothetical protein
LKETKEELNQIKDDVNNKKSWLQSVKKKKWPLFSI